MAEEKTKPKIESNKTEQPKAEVKNEEKATETKVEEKKQEVKKEVAKITKKDEAITRGTNLHISMKQGMHICRFIKGKSIDDSIKDLEDVIKMKRVVPFTGEIPHRSQPGIMSGRYPINASKIFISILKTLKGNVLANQMDLDKTKIYLASSSYASRPSKRGGGRFKRTNIVLKAKEVVK